MLRQLLKYFVASLIALSTPFILLTVILCVILFSHWDAMVGHPIAGVLACHHVTVAVLLVWCEFIQVDECDI